jgi:peptidoglycan/LPS O-acetylase OafA/YrhL
MATIKTVRAAAAVLLVLGTVKYLAILIDAGFDLSQAPHFFLVAFALPFGLVLLLLSRLRRTGLVLMLLVGGPFVAFLVGNVIQNGFAKEGWADYLVVYAGAPVAAVGVIAAARCLQTTRQQVAS